MTREELTSELLSALPSLTPEEGGEWLNVFVEPTALYETAAFLKRQPQFAMDYLFCLTCVDWKTHLTMVYHLSSTIHRHTMVLKSKLNRDQPVIDSVYPLWKTAEFHEREVFELFGVVFTGHPDLRKLILPDDWIGFPLRKDYDDPVNMIKL